MRKFRMSNSRFQFSQFNIGTLKVLFGKRFQAYWRFLFAFSITLVLMKFNFDFVDSYLYDLRMRLKPTTNTSGLIETIAIDSQTLDKLHRSPNAVDHVELLKKLKAAQVKAVIYFIHPGEVVGSLEEQQEFANEAQSIEHFYIGINDVWPHSQDFAYLPHPPFQKIKTLSAPYTSDRKLGAKDDVTRRMITSFQGEDVLHTLIAKMIRNEKHSRELIKGEFSYYASKQVLIDFHPSKTYPQISFSNLVVPDSDFSEDSLQKRFKDKIVLIGRDIPTTVDDYVRTPYSRDVIAMSALELHANMLDTLILNTAIQNSPQWINLISTGLISLLTIYVVLTLAPSTGLLILLGALSIYTFFSILMFWIFHINIDLSHPLIAIFVCYYFFIPYRLIIENRKSWEYFEKNKLLVQVEELKTNFLSMMSHDLKTPLARIQGMADVVLSDTQSLSLKQKNALETIRKSADELIEFISSILNLGRIESKDLKLNLKSKDPNQIVEEVIQKYEFLANTKNIQIQKELEPMFSIKMDIDLMRQVLSNLLENAIKYSPENSKILVSTEERDGFVYIQFTDQGSGIQEEEIGQIFTKFYRSKKHKTSSIKGSGLGLYLAKYFVELHHGRITVDSSPGQGSSFSVELPVSDPEKL